MTAPAKKRKAKAPAEPVSVQRTMEQLLAERYTAQVQELWPTIGATARERLLRQTTPEGLDMTLADIRKERM